MEAKRTYPRTGPSRPVLAALGVLLAVILMVSVLMVSRLSFASTPTGAGVVTSQPGGSEAGSAWNFRTRRDGTQSEEGPGGPVASSPAAREPVSGGSGPQLLP
jgi:hypothetical protein